MTAVAKYEDECKDGLCKDMQENSHPLNKTTTIQLL